MVGRKTKRTKRGGKYPEVYTPNVPISKSALAQLFHTLLHNTKNAGREVPKLPDETDKSGIIAAINAHPTLTDSQKNSMIAYVNQLPEGTTYGNLLTRLHVPEKEKSPILETGETAGHPIRPHLGAIKRLNPYELELGTNLEGVNYDLGAAGNEEYQTFGQENVSSEQIYDLGAADESRSFENPKYASGTGGKRRRRRHTKKHKKSKKSQKRRGKKTQRRRR